ncbi:SH3 domain-containing protein [Francisella sp. SYW-9]|uniref:SH3 domain-containing protein n=1 Tax=Francisella sp. SYW-9 TaxID=2610888 RepID=UPI00123D49C3|nr:SH3 domain-containing protein [Francisella sp. SYW-9]
MKKIILTISLLIFGASLGLAMSSDKPVSTTKQEQSSNRTKDKAHHKLVAIYTNEDTSSKIIGHITFKNQDSYNVFYCKNTGWCEVVNKANGSTGWVSLDQLKQAQQKYASYMQNKDTIKKLVEYTAVQDQKIAQLHAMMMQMQKEFATVLQKQQVQINQLSKAYYYQ